MAFAEFTICCTTGPVDIDASNRKNKSTGVVPAVNPESIKSAVNTIDGLKPTFAWVPNCDWN